MGLLKFFTSPEKASKKEEEKQAKIAEVINLSIEEKGFLSIELKGSDKRFSSRLIGIVSDKSKKTLLIKDIISLDEKVLQNSDSIMVYLQAGGNLFKFTSKFKQKNKKTKLINIQYPEEILPAQRRQFFRVEPSGVYPVNISFTIKGKEFETSSVSDISGGGISFTLWENVLSEGMIIKPVAITLPNSKAINVAARVLKSTELQPATKYNLEFTHIQSIDRESIIAYVVAKQRNEKSDQ